MLYTTMDHRQSRASPRYGPLSGGCAGTGKSHTMQGLNEPPEMRGIIPNSFEHIFSNISIDQTKEFLVIRPALYTLYIDRDALVCVV